MKRGKAYRESLAKVDRYKQYEVTDAMPLCKETAKAKFDETVELHIRLGVDSRHADQQVRGSVVLPNGVGKNVRVAVIARNDAARDATEAGAEIVGDDELVNRILNENFMDFDVLITTPDMMSIVSRLGRLLGPRGLMPNPRAGTVTQDVGRAVTEAKAGRIEYRLDRSNIIHVPIGKTSFSPEMLVENFETIIRAVVGARPTAARGQYIRSCVIASTMGPGIKVSTQRYLSAPSTAEAQ